MASFKTSGTEVCGDTPVGALTAYCGNFAFSATNQIDGWVLCDGATYNNTSGKYNTLTSMSIGSISGTNYISPNLTGRMALGRDAATNNTSNTGGLINKTLSINEYPSHTHTAIFSAHANHTHTYTELYNSDNVDGFSGAGDTRNMGYLKKTTTSHNHNHNVFTSGNMEYHNGIGQSFSILNKHVGVKWLLKY